MPPATPPLGVVCVGDVLLDVEVTTGGGPHDARVRVRAGGSALHAAAWAARAGAAATLVGRVGDDAAARLIRAEIARVGVADALVADATLPTGTAVLVDGAPHVDRGANRALRPEDVAVGAADAVLVSGYALLHDDSRAAARAALDGGAAWTAGTGGSARLVARVGPAAFAGVRVLVVDAAEARALTGAEPEAAALALARVHEVACVTLGGDGAVLATGESTMRAAAPRVDGTAPGAGDAFAATLLVALARGDDAAAALRDACEAGAAAAAAP